MSLLIKNGRIITAADDYIADLLVEGPTISAIGKNLSVKTDRTIDATGMLVLPGGIDPHVHLDMPFMGTFSSDTYETGTRAALFGGTTMVIDFVLQKLCFQEQLRKQHEKEDFESRWCDGGARGCRGLRGLRRGSGRRRGVAAEREC